LFELKITADAKRSVHLGEKLGEGIRWSADTLGKQAALVTAMARDTVTSILDPRYVERAVRELEREAGHPVTAPAETIKVIGAQLRYTQAQQDDILNHSIAGGDLTAGGIMHAVTSVAQVQDDGDAAWDLESTALDALRLAARL
jgi:hypothetical protein